MTDVPPERILVVGMMGAGKTSVGRELARRLGWPFLDNDALVRELTGRDADEIDANDGEDALHDAEADAFHAALARARPAVVAVAGAIVDRPIERDRLGASGHVVWLRARPATLRARIAAGVGRRDEATDLGWLAARAAERAGSFTEVADQIVDVDDRSIDETVAAILAAVVSAG